MDGFYTTKWGGCGGYIMYMLKVNPPLFFILSLSPIFFLFLFYTCGVVTASAYDKNSTKNPIDSHYTRAQQERLRPPVSTMAIKVYIYTYSSSSQNPSSWKSIFFFLPLLSPLILIVPPPPPFSVFWSASSISCTLSPTGCCRWLSMFLSIVHQKTFLLPFIFFKYISCCSLYINLYCLFSLSLPRRLLQLVCGGARSHLKSTTRERDLFLSVIVLSISL